MPIIHFFAMNVCFDAIKIIAGGTVLGVFRRTLRFPPAMLIISTLRIVKELMQ